jgi:hypothetical protein
MQAHRDFIDAHGPVKGEQVWNAWLDQIAGTSMVNPIDNNIRSSTWYLQQMLQGKPLPQVIQLKDPFHGQTVQTLAGGPPAGYGAKSQVQHAARVRQFMANDLDPVANAKPVSFRQNLGGNWMPRTVDTHDIRNAIGMPRAKKLFNEENSSLLAGEYSALEGLGARAAGRAGSSQAAQQAATWIGGGKYTGLKSNPVPFMEALSRRIAVTAKVRGHTPEKVWHDMITGKDPLFARGGRVYADGGAVGDDYNTAVPDEAAFQQWKAANAPDDSGIDYDLRGAYLANMQRAENGHMGDQFKKPNHPTFSDQSQYAVGDQRARMGYWVGDTFVPPVARAKGGRVGYEEGGDVDDAPRFDPTRLAAAPARAFNPAMLREAPMSATDVISGAVANAPDSAWQFAKDVVRPITHPIETLSGIKDLGLGLLEKSGAVGTILPPTGGGHEKYADAMMDYIKNRYGGVENIKKSIAKDPVGVLSDASMILTGGGTAAARVPGFMGKAGEITANVGRAVDPLMAIPNAAKVGTKVVGETLTHTGATPLENAYRAGVEGGDAGEVFRGHMRGTADSVEPVEMAKRGLAGYRAARGAAYREGMGDITSVDRQMGPLDRVLDFGKIEDAVDKTERLHKFGVMDINQPASAVRKDMMGKIAEWKALPPLEYHTLEGLDALKKSLGQVMTATEAGTPARTAAGEIYNAVRKTIVEYDPKYAKVMQDYEKASTQIKELEKAMSLGQKATADTALRKLQSIMRNNVNTNYGRRLELGKLLEENGATHLMAALSGQSLSAWFPRGLGKLGAEFALLGGAGHFISPWTLAATPLMSPRLMGELSHGVGRTVGRGLNASNRALSGIGGNRAAGNVSYRLGRATNPYENEDPANPYAR